MTWGKLRRRRRDLPAYLLISTLGYPPSADWYHTRCCRGGRFALIAGRFFGGELLTPLTHNNELTESSTLSIRAGSQTAQVCLISSLPIKDPLLNTPDAPVLGTVNKTVKRKLCTVSAVLHSNSSANCSVCVPLMDWLNKKVNEMSLEVKVLSWWRWFPPPAVMGGKVVFAVSKQGQKSSSRVIRRLKMKSRLAYIRLTLPPIYLSILVCFVYKNKEGYDACVLYMAFRAAPQNNIQIVPVLQRLFETLTLLWFM